MESGKRISRTSTIILKAPLETVFPLFGPIKEMEWAEGWQPEIIYSQADNIEAHMVFKTKAHGHGEPDYIWTVSRYDPTEALIEYTIFTPNRLWYITVQCRESADAQTTQATISYTYTALNELGAAINQRAIEAMYAHNLKDWEEAINFHLSRLPAASSQSSE
ncbi:MAG: SRPBCC family protein [Anaerolineae bacterium]